MSLMASGVISRRVVPPATHNERSMYLADLGGTEPQQANRVSGQAHELCDLRARDLGGGTA